MIILSEKKYLKAQFTNEAEIENVVKLNYEFLFGPSSIYLPKMLIKTNGGTGTIPDGFAIDIDKKIWYLVEAELIIHPVWDHISKQVTKQMLASRNALTKNLLQDIIVEMYKKDDNVKEKFTELGIQQIDVRKVLQNILNKDPIVGIPIDALNQDITEWATVFKFQVKLWVITKYVDIHTRKEVAYEFPEEFKPELDTETIDTITSNDGSDKTSKIRIIDLLRNGLLEKGQELSLEYKQRKGATKQYLAIIDIDGSLRVLGNAYPSPSSAAIVCIQDAGSDRTTINGWTNWKTLDGKRLSDLRNQMLAKYLNTDDKDQLDIEV